MSKSAIAALLELVGGYFGLLGLGWIYGGDILRGVFFLIGYLVLLSVGGTLVAFTLGLLAIIFVPLYFIVPIISAFKVHQFVNDRWW